MEKIWHTHTHTHSQHPGRCKEPGWSGWQLPRNWFPPAVWWRPVRWATSCVREWSLAVPPWSSEGVPVAITTVWGNLILQSRWWWLSFTGTLLSLLQPGQHSPLSLHTYITYSNKREVVAMASCYGKNACVCSQKTCWQLQFYIFLCDLFLPTNK